jgi:adenylate kinase family enzyme
VRRVVVVGPGGSGKTVFAERLSQRTGIPVVHLDRIFYRDGWNEVPREEAVGELERAIAGDRWIVDGNFLDAGDSRFARADTVVFLDPPRWLCLLRIVRRRIRDRGKERPDLPGPEGLDWEFMKWTWRYPHELDLPNVVRLRSRADGDAMIRRSG